MDASEVAMEKRLMGVWTCGSSVAVPKVRQILTYVNCNVFTAM